MSFGRPLMIAGGEAVRLPETIDDNQLSDVIGNWKSQPASIPSLLGSYVQTIKLYGILKEVLDREELKDSSDICLDIHSILRLDTMIMKWRDALPSYLRYDPLANQPNLAESHTANANAISQADFSAQAKRLYTR